MRADRIDRIAVPFHLCSDDGADPLTALRLEVISSRVKKQERTAYLTG